MTVEEAVWLGQSAMFTTLLVAGPLLVASAVVGILVGLLQTVTQIQEATLVFIPKMVVVMVVLAAAGGFMLETAVSFATTSFVSIAEDR